MTQLELVTPLTPAVVPDISDWDSTGLDMTDGFYTSYYDEGVLLSEAVGLWHLDESAGTTSGTTTDASTNGNDGTLNNFSLPNGFVSPGQFDNALSFDGTNDYVNMGDVLDMGLGDLSIGVWIKTSSSVSQMMVAKAWSTPYYYLQTNSSGNAVVVLHNGTSAMSVTSAAPVNDGSWHHIVGVFDRDQNLTLYVDGSPSGTPVDISGDVSTDISNNNEFAIGANCQADCSTSIGNFFEGLIDEVGIWNRALTTAEIGILANPNPLMIQPGKGYFLRGGSNNPVIDVPSGSTAVPTLSPLASCSGLSTDGYFVSLDPDGGWNIIGDPFTEQVPLSSTWIVYERGTASESCETFQDAVAAGNIGGALYEYNGATYNALVCNTGSCDGTMEPWKGYWMQVLKNIWSTIEIIMPDPTTP